MISNGPIIFPTTGMDRALGALPATAAFAAGIGRRLLVLHLIPRRYEAFARRRVAEALAELGGSAEAELHESAPKLRLQTLRALAGSQGGLIAAQLKRRGFLARLATIMPPDEQLVIDGPLPVLALPQSGALPGAVRRVLFPLDLSPRSDAALDEVAAFCNAQDAELHLLHVFGPDRLPPSELSAPERAAAATPSELYQVDKRRMEELAARASAAGAKVTLSQAEGRAHSAILGYVGPNDIDLVAMASHGPRSGEDIWYGSTTMRVCRSAAVPVLAMRA